MSANFWRHLCEDIAAANPFHHEDHTMSETTVTPVENSTVTGIISTLESILPLVVAGRLNGVNTTLHADLEKYDAAANAKLDELKTSLDKFETSSPLAQQIITAVLAVLKASGLQTPTEAGIFLALKVVVDALFAIAKPAPTAS